jgi:serine/threonine-protein kinase
MLAVAIGLARGLARAHRRGVLHRDIKPANAVLGDDGAVKLLDFGLAELVHSATPPGSGRNGGRVGGTPLYMAPELWQGEPTTPRSDVYALGVLLYELASGRAPHADASAAVLPRLACEGSPRSLAEVAPAVEPPLAAIVDRCIACDPA